MAAIRVPLRLMKRGRISVHVNVSSEPTDKLTRLWALPSLIFTMEKKVEKQLNLHSYTVYKKVEVQYPGSNRSYRADWNKHSDKGEEVSARRKQQGEIMTTEGEPR